MSTYKFMELVGTSSSSWEDAAKQALDEARSSLPGLRVAEVERMDIKIVGESFFYRVRLKVSFKIRSLKRYAEIMGIEPED